MNNIQFSIKERATITGFVIRALSQCEREGLRWRPLPQSLSPNSWGDLKAAWLAMQRDGVPIPIADDEPQSHIYVGHGYYWVRAWHDWRHLRAGRSFSLTDELVVANLMLRDLEHLRAPGWVQQSIYHDFGTGARYYNLTGEYVVDQRAFVSACLKRGADPVLAKVREGVRW